jgi:DNA-binding transcriptional MerR regulator
MPAKYSIKDLERLSGIKAHTLRIWEQRYELFSPARTTTNIRWYTAGDLRKLLNVSVLNNHGIKISKIASMKEDAINKLVVEYTETTTDEAEQVTALVMAMVDLNEARFDKIISLCFMRFGFEKTVEEIIYPFFRKIGVMWQTGSINPVQEHFISNLVRQKIIVAIDGLVPTQIEKPKTFVLYLPNNELHELSLLYYCYKIRSRGHQVIYLGQSVPVEDLETSFDQRPPHFFLTVLTHEIKDVNLQEYLNRLSKKFPESTFLVSGFQMMKRKLSLPRNIQVFKEPSDIHVHL